jgi:single stranded DNA-binding protein
MRTNEIRLVGNVVKEPMVREGANGPFAIVRIAVNNRWGEKEETLYIDTKLFGKSYNDIEYYEIDKGDRVQVDGRLVMEEFTNKEGNDVKLPAIIANSLVKFHKRVREATGF